MAQKCLFLQRHIQLQHVPDDAGGVMPRNSLVAGGTGRPYLRVRGLGHSAAGYKHQKEQKKLFTHFGDEFVKMRVL